MKPILEGFESSLNRILDNDYWKTIYEAAPNGARAYMELQFTASDKPSAEEKRNFKSTYESKVVPMMDKESWEYLAENYAGCEQQADWFRQQLKEEN